MEDQKYLANIIGRPLSILLSIPLFSENGDYVIYIENQLSDEELAEFFAFMGDRISSLEMTLDRIVLDQEINSASYMWESTFDGIDSPVAIVDKEYNIYRKNKFFNANSKTCFQALGDETSKCNGCPLDQAYKTKKPASNKIEVNEKKYIVHTYPFSDASQSKQLFVNLYTDITKSENLHGQIIQNEKMSAVGNLADHIAHELNNPLTGIRSLAQVLISEQEEGQLKEDLIEIEKATERSQLIINNLIEFSKAGISHKAETIDLAELVAKTIPFLKSVMGQFERNIELAEGVKIKIDPQLGQQVIFNLINNACQSMGDSGILTLQVYSNQNIACFKVKDTGAGIPTKNLKSIFEPFFTTKKEGEGTGLGLSVCKNIITTYGGKIEVASQVGNGTEFTIQMPMVSE